MGERRIFSGEELAEGEKLAANSLSFQAIDFVRFSI